MSEAPETPVLLVVEDDKDVRDSLMTSLTTEGFEVITAEDARTGLALLEKRDGLSLVILDYLLGDSENGNWFLDRMRELPARKEVPVVIITASGREVVLPEGIPVLRKPFDLNALLSVVQTYCPNAD